MHSRYDICIVINCGIRENFLPMVIGSLLNQNYDGYILINLNYFSSKEILKKYDFFSNVYKTKNIHLQINYLEQPDTLFNISYGNNIGAYLSASEYLFFTPADIDAVT